MESSPRQCRSAEGQLFVETIKDKDEEDQKDEELIEGDNEITVSMGQSQTIRGITITLNSFVQESRCPVDAVCIEAGAVVVNVTLSGYGKTISRNFPSDEAPFEFGDFDISIERIEPALYSNRTILESEYVITFKVVPR